MAMVLAVNWPGQEPTVVAQLRSMAWSWAREISPVWCRPVPSMAVSTLCSRPSGVMPGSIEPP